MRPLAYSLTAYQPQPLTTFSLTALTPHSLNPQCGEARNLFFIMLAEP
jgi:hypothetical protein